VVQKVKLSLCHSIELCWPQFCVWSEALVG
jgi:hypothetical protein